MSASSSQLPSNVIPPTLQSGLPQTDRSLLPIPWWKPQAEWAYCFCKREEASFLPGFHTVWRCASEKARGVSYMAFHCADMCIEDRDVCRSLTSLPRSRAERGLKQGCPHGASEHGSFLMPHACPCARFLHQHPHQSFRPSSCKNRLTSHTVAACIDGSHPHLQKPRHSTLIQTSIKSFSAAVKLQQTSLCKCIYK